MEDDTESSLPSSAETKSVWKFDTAAYLHV
jgi:hypothetical protein